MQTVELKQKAIKGMFWSFCERFGSLFILFISNIILARLLTPENYGLIGMLMVFITISSIFVDGGFGSALIQRENPTDKDYSTIFFVNIFIAILSYCILYLCSGAISNFYNYLDLKKLLKILGLVIILDSFGCIQNNILVKTLNFKRITFIKVSAAILASMSAIVAAVFGCGVWSLVIQYLTNSIFKTILLWITADWYPSFVFSLKSLKSLFGFGSNLLIAGLISEVYRNIQILIIGKFFPAQDVGYFSQAKQLENVPTSSIIAIVNQVTYPVFSQLQNSKDALVRGLRRALKTLVFINFPAVTLLAVIAKPLFLLLYSSKWLPAVPYFQWLCLGFGLFLVVHNANLNALKVIGKSNVVLYLEIIKRFLGLTFIFIFISFGVMGILWALALCSLIEFFLNGYFTGKYIGYGIHLQLKDIFPTLLVTIIAAVCSYAISLFELHYLLCLILQIITFCGIYLAQMQIFQLESFRYIKDELMSRMKK